MKKIKVSVLLPTYNGAKFIAKSIESVLGQDFYNLELIIINDGSSDEVSSIVEGFVRKDNRVVFVSNRNNLGIQKTLNIGLEIAGGEYIARIDDDDEWVEHDKLSRQVKFLDNNSDYVLVGTGVIVVDEDRNEIFRFLQPTDDKSIRDRMLFKSSFMHSSVLFRSEVVNSIGGYSEEEKYKHIEDYYLWLELGRIGKLGNLPSYDIKFMQRGGAITAIHKSEQFKKIIKMVKLFRRDYPHFRIAIFFAYLRSMLFVFDRVLPFTTLRNWFIKRYKSI